MDQPDIAPTLTVTQAMADRLATYLRGDSLYQQLTVETPAGVEQPVMTPGGLLERIQALRWAQSAMTAEQRQQLAAIEDRVDHDRQALNQQWRAFLRRELNAVLDSWAWYLDDAQRSQRARDNYRSEVHNRTRLDLLLRQLGDDPAVNQQRQRLAGLDARLRRLLQGSNYVGPGGDESRYPPGEYWWMYGRLVGQDEE